MFEMLKVKFVDLIYIRPYYKVLLLKKFDNNFSSSPLLIYWRLRAKLLSTNMCRVIDPLLRSLCLHILFLSLVLFGSHYILKMKQMHGSFRNVIMKTFLGLELLC